MFDWITGKKEVQPEIQTKSVSTQVFFEGSPFFIGLKGCNSALDGYKNKVVFAVTNTLVNKLLEVPILATKLRNEKHAAYFNNGKAGNPEKMLMAKALGLTELPEHPLLDLFDSPNEYQTGLDLRRAFWFNRILTGAGIMWVERAGDLSRKAGKVKGIHVLPTNKVSIEESGDWKDPIKSFSFMTPDGKQLPLRKQDVIYSGTWNPDSMYKGFNPFDSVGQTVNKNNINDLAQVAAFKNGGTGILFSSDTVTDGVGGVSDKVTPEQMAELKETIVREYAGAANNKKMHFTNGYINVTSFGDTLADLKLIEASETEVKEICAVFGVSPILIGEGKSNTESNVVQAYKSLVTNNVVPKLREFDQSFNKFCKDWFKDGVKIHHDITEFAELMPNMKLVLEVYGNNPAITLNELRLMLGMDEIDDPLYNKSYIQSGFVSLEDAGFAGAYTQPQNG